MRWIPRFRFRLATLLVVVTALCVWLGVTVERLHKQKRAVTRLEKLGAGIWFDYQQDGKGGFDIHAPLPGPEWARNVLGDDYFRKVLCVRMWDARLTDNDVAAIAALRDLETLGFYRVDFSAARSERLAGLENLKRLLMNECVVADHTLAPLSRLTNLVQLDLTDMDLDDTRLPPLGALTSLEMLRLTGTKVTGSGFGNVRSLARLSTLFLNDTPFGDRGMEAIGSLSAIKHLDLDARMITDRGLAHLPKLTSLERLDLHHAVVTDKGLAQLGNLTSLTALVLRDAEIRASSSAFDHLRGLANLKLLYVDPVSNSGTKITVPRLRQALPNCQMSFGKLDTAAR